MYIYLMKRNLNVFNFTLTNILYPYKKFAIYKNL